MGIIHFSLYRYHKYWELLTGDPKFDKRLMQGNPGTPQQPELLLSDRQCQHHPGSESTRSQLERNATSWELGREQDTPALLWAVLAIARSESLVQSSGLSRGALGGGEKGFAGFFVSFQEKKRNLYLPQEIPFCQSLRKIAVLQFGEDFGNGFVADQNNVAYHWNLGFPARPLTDFSPMLLGVPLHKLFA